MATMWSSEQIVADYGDLQAKSMAVDCLGLVTVIAGRKALTFVDLRNPTEPLARHPRQSKWEKWDINCVQWNPHPSHAHNFVTACNERLDLFAWKDGVCTNQCMMKGHSRSISDIDWSPFDVNVIASCSVDTFIHLWDVRDPRKPQSSFQTVAGASQVMWNKIQTNQFATTHEGDVRLWDPRKGNSPLTYIAAHLSKIHGLDWSPHSENCLATASQDGSVKFWDVTNFRQAKGSMSAGCPVWRARYTPFGHGLVTVAVPQIRRGDNSLYLWTVEDNVQLVHQFMGHQDAILEFQWRKQTEEERDFQLVTWARDQTLRVWKVDLQHQKLCGHDVGDLPDSEELSTMSLVSSTNSFEGEEGEGGETTRQPSGSPDSITAQQPRTLKQEFSLVNVEIPNIVVEELNPTTRTCIVLAMANNHNVRLKLVFPDNYPNNDMPSLDILFATINNKVQQRLHLGLTDICLKHVTRNTNCLEPVLRQLATYLEKLTIDDRRTPESETSMHLPFTHKPTKQLHGHNKFSAHYGPYHYLLDHNIPFPRTSGARFCAAGFLVVFGRAREAKKARTGADHTPKALSDLTQYGSRARIRSSHTAPTPYQQYSFARSPPTTSDPFTIKSYYYKDQKRKNNMRMKSKVIKDKSEDLDKQKGPHLAPVKIYDSSYLLPINKNLGTHYRIDLNDIPAMCRHNAAQAAGVGRKDLVQLWNLVTLMSDKRLAPSSNPDDGSPWGRHPFGRQLLKHMMDFYSSLHDVQTLAMLCCVFWNKQEVQRPLHQSSSVEYIPPTYSPYHTVSSSSSLLKGWSTVQKMRRSNSWSFDIDSIEDYKFDDSKDTKQKEAEREQFQHEINSRMMDPGAQQQYDDYLRAYANILYQWGRGNQATHVLKFVSSPKEQHKGIEFGLNCHRCRKEVRGPQCGSCKVLAFNCVICHIGVRGASNFCLTCGHGGHTNHIIHWFKTHDECPSGCGCKCIRGKTYITMSSYNS
ncbi:WD repeat-containing protein 59-like isoform X8 [Mizuhopecten yessoensis]|uniref:WD repeat-containing protein 59-like isoform X8 n=1 Tax=Mizuhopecten yessoensis TaxID=6573 RepID=UPI000B45DC30|nr:WD repeat-containing protein 59-like isoform X8 [Mizuhopecten yessoensis]